MGVADKMLKVTSMEKQPLIVIVGAGASVKAGIQSTEALSDVATRALPTLKIPPTPYAPALFSANEPPISIPRSIQLANILDSALRADYESVDFELVLHALEQLESFNTTHTVRSQDGNQPVMASFAELSRRYELLDDPALIRMARLDVTTAIHSAVGSNCTFPLVPDAPRARAQLASVFDTLSQTFRLIVIDLNYDDLIDRTGVSWEDGFSADVPDYECKLFSPVHWLEAVSNPSANLLMHIHGSVRFGYRPQTHLSSISYSEPARYERIQAATETIARTTTSGTTVDGQIYDGGSIISGRGKAGKLAYNARPYGYYQQAISSLVPLAKHLLVLGYGWRDEHINTWITEMIDLQPDLVSTIVTYRKKEHAGENTTIEYRNLNRLVVTSAWSEFDALGLAAAWNDEPHFYSKDRFAIAPCGFILSSSTQERLLQFVTRQ